MFSMLFDGPTVTHEEILHAKEVRANIQKNLLKANPQAVLLSATMNIPGPVKTSEEIAQVFHVMIDAVEKSVSEVRPLVHLYRKKKTGYEYFLVLPLGKETLKKRMIELEETCLFGRLVDLDVLFWEEGQLQPVSRDMLGYKQRTCFICSEEAKVCSRQQKHPFQEIRNHIQQLVEKGRE
ncbi:citrate lyase holo-[acyl-carrier protein] synthase [Enterococcus sp. DIV1298c]|uniref:citrate lyase holo-[acyl-carrier protein] synthase n=1 Tax=Enterococcus sp. DIV1298c TaxID=2815328 RepID=UPI001A91DFAA|nr:citrate lyase holo-[acyl-carrier protein] synthase [Enterococcus sp. DIV1298c]MBO0460852.1 citrate lyase holo-[acyl-carrier protein] synthase [Enterococcus sp. DIV1298c]